MPSARQGAGTIFDQALYSLTNFVVGVLLARALAQEDYGVYVLFLSLIMAIMGIQRALISAPYTIRSKTYREKELDEYTGSAVVHETILVATAVSLGLAFINFAPVTGNAFSISVSFVIATAGILIRDFVRFFLLSTLKVRQSILAGLSINGALLALTLILFIWNQLSVVSGLLAIGFCSLIPSIIAFRASANIAVSKAPIIAHFLHNFRLGKWMLGSAAISVVSSQAYVWLLAFLADTKAVAILGVVSSLANLLNPLLQGAGAFLLPKMVEAREHQGSDAITRIARKAAAVLFVVFLGWLACGVVIGNFLLESIYSTKYSGNGDVLVILILYSFVSALTMPASSALDALQRSEASFRSSLIALVVTLSIGTAFIYEWGLHGAALSALLANTVNLFLRWRALSVRMHR